MIRIVDEAGSTNDDMAAWAAADAAEGDWLVARRQTAGRGRLGRGWQAPDGNLSASGLVRLRANDPPAPTIALVAGIAAAATVAAWLPAGVAPMLKWPNDVLVDGAKIVGILTERQGAAAIVGIGINIAAAPALPDRPTTCLAALGGATPDPAAAAAALEAYFAIWLAMWRNEGVQVIAAAWCARAHPIDTPLRIAAGDGTIDGTFAGLTAAGALRLRLADGTEQVIHAGDVALR